MSSSASAIQIQYGKITAIYCPSYLGSSSVIDMSFCDPVEAPAGPGVLITGGLAPDG